MITLVIGGSGSGKSAFAEELLSDYKGRKYYLATMQVYDDDARGKVERHRQMREGKGFETLEQPRAIDRGVANLSGKACAVLLECMSNLVANEMFREDGIRSVTETVDAILPAVFSLAQMVDELVIVTNNVAEDGVNYDAATIEYIHAIGDINVGLAEMADRVVEVSMGLPLWLK